VPATHSSIRGSNLAVSRQFVNRIGIDRRHRDWYRTALFFGRFCLVAATLPTQSRLDLRMIRIVTAWRPWRLLVTLIAALAADCGARAVAQTALPPQTSAKLAAESSKPTESSTGEDSALASQLADLNRRIAEEQRIASERAAKTDEFEKLAANAVARLAILRRQPDEPQSSSAEWFCATGSVVELEQQLVAAESSLAAERKKLVELESEPKRRSLRRLEIGKLAAAAEAKLAELTAEVAKATADAKTMDTADRTAEASGSNAAPLAAALHKLYASRQASLQAELRLYQQELASYDAAGSELLTRERDQQARVVIQAEKQVPLLRNAVADARRQEAEMQAHEARIAAAAAEPATRGLAERNQALAEQRKQLAERIDTVSRQAEAVTQLLTNVKDDHRSLLEKERAAGLTNAIGQLLRKKRGELPDLRQVERDNAERQEEIARVQLRLFDLSDRRRELADLETPVAATLALLGDSSHVREDDVRALLETERAYLDSLIADSDVYFNRMVALDDAERKLIAETEKLAAYIDRHVLWIRSAKALDLNDVANCWPAAQWLLAADNWRDAAQTTWATWRDAPFAGTGLLLLLAALVAYQRRYRDCISAAGRRANRLYMPTVLPTFQAIAATALLAAGWPLAVASLGWLLSSSHQGFPSALASALSLVAAVYLPLELVRQSLRPFGLAEAHFRWPRAPLGAVRTQLRWLMIGGLPLVLVTATVQEQSNDVWRDSFARFGFVAIMVVLAISVHKILKQVRRASAPAKTAERPAIARQLPRFGQIVLTAVPVALAVLAATGYYYTAVRLTQRLQSTLWLVLSIIAVHAVLVRCLRIAHRRLEHRAEAERDGETAESCAVGEAGAVPVEHAVVDLGAVSLQTQRLLYSLALLALLLGASWIWIDVSPALGFLNRVSLWQDADRGFPITLADLSLSLLIAVMTVIAARNLPGLLEIAVLQHLPLEPAGRFAISTVARYLIVVIGLVSAFAAIGVGWSKVQWLVAAVTFGLGFGLQEVFANFISGLIVLFERPMRVGDVVTVGEVSGVVSRIRMRATTITDWDRKELIVPNKEFITGRLVNWTLSDRVLRIVFRVGVAYGSDTRLAQRLLLKAAADHPSVLQDPPPQALFVAFGDSTLAFELRVYVPGLEVYGAVQHELNTAIDTMFRAAGIDIAFPQRDVHVRSIDAALTIERRRSGPRAFVGPADPREGPHVASA
jgi:potassium efflux system protein